MVVIVAAANRSTQGISYIATVGSNVQSVVGEVVADREEVVLCKLLVALKVPQVRSQLCPEHGCSEAVDPL